MKTRHEIVIQTVDIETQSVVRSTAQALTLELVHELGSWAERVLETHVHDLQHPRCPGCGQEINPDLCYCGVGPNDSHDEHVFTPMGCVCGYSR
jgi:hypothetical protein